MQRRPSHPLISGNAFRSLAGVRIEKEGGVSRDPSASPQVIFAESDLISEIPKHITGPCVVITHNADHAFSGSHLFMLEDERIVAWFAQNMLVVHPKLFPIPIGVANEKWEHGNVSVFVEAINNPKPRGQMFNALYNRRTTERYQCERATGIAPGYAGFRSYVDIVARSYYTLSPSGCGVDCHRTWEALYLGSCPVVLDHPTLGAYYGDKLPMIRLGTWDDFDKPSFTPERHAELWAKGFKPQDMFFEPFVEHWMVPHCQGIPLLS